ncbi:hypothetical protein C8Q74DRAFT_1209386 [Fomes fomentarius]|nr:hypothetical protein C8Q74DRAFT_1209386 [Fomes fomentarius]
MEPNSISITSYGPKVFAVSRGQGGQKQLEPSITIHDPATMHRYDTCALIDSGCTGSCINRSAIARWNLMPVPLDKLVPVRNADGSLNAGGSISHFVPLQLQIEEHLESIQLLVTDIGSHNIFLGHD